MERVLNTEFPSADSISEKSESRNVSESSSLRQVLLRGVSALGAATLLERSLTYTANLFAARCGGPQVFGAYSLSLTTANTVATYSGMGIGTVATRFSGDYPPGSSIEPPESRLTTKCFRNCCAQQRPRHRRCAQQAHLARREFRMRRSSSNTYRGERNAPAAATKFKISDPRFQIEM
jgi:hypothetical protein